MSSNFGILGDGAWGTALALLLAQRAEHRVTLWSALPENARRLRECRENVRLLPGIRLPESIRLTEAEDEAVDQADLLISAIPTMYLRPTLHRFRERVHAQSRWLSVTKGLENDTFLRPSQIIQEILQVREVAVLSGPSHAEEVSRGLPAAVVIACQNLDLAHWLQSCFNTDRFRVYTNQDVIGVELGGALKNVIGIAAGIGDGLGMGDNTKSALLTRGLVEMTRFAIALGAEPQTLMGLAGLGDLITTSISPHGRNRYVGECLGKGEPIASILARMSMVAEGVTTARSVHQRAERMGLEMPITTEVYRVLYENKDPRAAVADLMLRQPRQEGLR